MQLWRFSSNRSLRRSVNRRLRRARTDRLARVYVRQAAMSGRGAGFAIPLTLSVLLHAVCVGWLVHHAAPNWLEIAWQVSASLVGLGVALVIFLLQAAAGQSVASRYTYRAMVGATGLIWPATMALVFLVAVAVIERYGDGAAPPAWAETFILVVFAAQVVAFGVAFVRTLTVVTPGGVAEVVERAFGDLLHVGVENALRRHWMREDWHSLCEAAGVDHNWLFARGRPVEGRRVGQAGDLDRRLPRAIADRGQAEAVTLTVEPGGVVGPEAPLARVTTPGILIEPVIRNGIHVNRRRDDPEPVEVFDDVIDLCRRELQDGSSRSMQRTWRMVVDTLAELPRVYARWQANGPDAVVNHGVLAATEAELLQRVADFNAEVLESRNVDAILLLPMAAAGLVDAGLRADGFPLVVGACRLWQQQIAGALTLADDVGRRLHDTTGQLAYQAVLAQQARLMDVDLPMSRRLGAVQGLELLFDHEMRAMKIVIDAGDADRLESLWHHWVTWARGWEPENHVDDLELQTLAGSVSAQREAIRSLQDARELVEIKRRLERRRRDAMFSLGAWALWRWERGTLDDETWTAIDGYLAGAVSTAQAAVDYVTLSAADALVSRIEHWQLGVADRQSGWLTQGGYPLVRRWAVVLLLKRVDLAGSSNWDLGDWASEIAKQVDTDLSELERDRPRWVTAIGADLDDRIKAVRDGLSHAAKEAEVRAGREVAEASIDRARVAAYAAKQRQAYASTDVLRGLLLQGGGIEVRTTADRASDDYAEMLIHSKRPFTALTQTFGVLDDDAPGRRLAQQEMHRLYAELAARAEERSAADVDLRAVDLAVEAIAELRQSGDEPDVVLVPRDAYIRSFLSNHPDWKWASRTLFGTPDHLALLSGVPVYDVGPHDATWLVVASLSATVHRIEHRLDGEDSALSVEVKPISDLRARELLALRAVSPHATLDSVRDDHVEVRLVLDTDYEDAPSGRHSARRIALPPAGKRRRMDDT